MFVCVENCLQYVLIELNVPKHIPGTNICYLKRARRRWIQSITLIFLFFLQNNCFTVIQKVIRVKK